MNNQTRFVKNNKNNKIQKKSKTRKYFKKNFEKSKGIFDVIGNKLSNYSKDTSNYLTEKGLHLLGLKKINNEVEGKINNELEGENDSNILSNVNAIGKNIVNVADKTSAALIEQVNDVLESPKVMNSINDATEETVDIGKKILGNVNENLNNPQLKKETEVVMDNVGEYADIVVKSLDKPIDDAIDALNKSGTKATSGVVSGAIKVGTDALAAVPFLGAVVGLGKITNDVSTAIGKVVEAGSEASTTISNVIDESTKNIEANLNKVKNETDLTKFKNINKDNKKISSRIDKSLDEFENPFPSKGGKSRSKFSKTYLKKTKRVRFAI